MPLQYRINKRKENEKSVSIFVQHAYQKTTVRQLSHMLRQLQKMRSSSEVVSLRWGRCRWKQGMQYVVRPESCLVEQLIFRVIAQVTEHRCIRSAVSKASSAVDHWVDALTLGRLGETMPYAGCVPMTLSDLQGHSRTACFYCVIFRIAVHQ